MAPTKQTAKKSTGGAAPRQSLVKAIARAKALNRANQIVKPYTLSKRKWMPRYLKDRKVIHGFVHYLVLWEARDPRTNKFAESWEPVEALKGNDGLMDLVDEWISDGRKVPIWTYLGLDEDGEPVVEFPTASVGGFCTFEAVETACSLLGMFYPSDVFLQFLMDGETKPHDPRKGMKWSMVRAFCVKLNGAGANIDIPTLQHNLHQTSHMGTRAILDLQLADGVYLVAAENCFRRSHCAVLHVKMQKITVIDANGSRPLNRSPWIDKPLYVRKFQALA